MIERNFGDIEIGRSLPKVRRTKRSLESDAPNRWVGWPHILRLYDTARALDEEYETNVHGLYFTAIFESGGRESEVCLLRPTDFIYDEQAIEILRMDVFKRRKRHTRTVIIKIMDDPLAPILLDYVKDALDKGYKYLLPGFDHGNAVSRFSKIPNPNTHASTSHVYDVITRIHPDIWPHWLRDQRSWQLSAPADTGGRGFNPYLLKGWMDWARLDTTTRYAGRRSINEIREALGVKPVEQRLE